MAMHCSPLARADPPNIILLGDRFDPLFDTLALVEKLIQITPSSRIIVMSTLSDGLFIRDLFAIGVTGYLMVGDDLTTCLSTALEMALRQRLYLSPTANAEYLIAMQSRNRDWKLDSEVAHGLAAAGARLHGGGDRGAVAVETPARLLGHGKDARSLRRGDQRASDYPRGSRRFCRVS